MKGLGVIIGIVLLCLSSAILGAWIFDRFLDVEPPQFAADLFGNPGMDAVESYRCPRHLKKTVQILGVEDGYDRSNYGPARYHEALQASPRHQQIINNELGGISIRDYDETGSDKLLYEHIAFPRLTESSQVFFRLRKLPGSRNDAITIILLREPAEDIFSFEHLFNTSIPISEFSILAEAGSTDDLILTSPIQNFVRAPDGSQHMPLREYIEMHESDIEAILYIGDDLQIDFGALIHCENINEIKGTTFSERHLSFLKEGRSFLSCENGDNIQICDPHRGDYSCDMRLPLACYKPGTRSIEGFIDPESLGLYQTFNPDLFVGGEVKLTEPVVGNRFETRGDANKFCFQNFGSDWRPLTFHEAGRSFVASWSNVPDGSRVWIDVYGSPHANCWSESLEESPRD